MAARIAEQSPHRLAARLAEQVPQRHLDAGVGVRRLQQVHRVVGHVGRDARDVGRLAQRLAQHRVRDRAAHAVRLRADERGDRRQRRRLAFAPPDVSARRDAHQQGVLASVRLIGDLGHRQIEEIDGFDLHFGAPHRDRRSFAPQLGSCQQKKAADRNPPPFTLEKCRRALVHISRARRGAIRAARMFLLAAPRLALAVAPAAGLPRTSEYAAGRWLMPSTPSTPPITPPTAVPTTAPTGPAMRLPSWNPCAAPPGTPCACAVSGAATMRRIRPPIL